MRFALLDDTLEWPRDQWERGGPWRLGHGLTVVGPGWHPLVRRTFAAVAEVPGAEVRDVHQKIARLEIRIHHPHPTQQAALHTVAALCTEASHTRCEGCGTAVPAAPAGQVIWRTHCAECAAIIAAGGPKGERHLWEQRAGRPWPSLPAW